MVLLQAQYTAAQEQDQLYHGTYELVVDCGETHNIDYSITNATIQSIEFAGSVTVQVMLTAPSDDSGTLVLKLPNQFLNPSNMTADQGFEILALFDEAFDREARILNFTSSYMTVAVDFPRDIQIIDLIGAFIPFVPPPEILNVVAEGRTFPITVEAAPVCSWEFLKEEKKLRIYSDNITTIAITLPKELLGAPYTVLMDGQENKFLNYQSGNANYTTISVSKEGFEVGEKADVVEIIGTTAIPEFGSSVVLAVTAAAIGSILVLSRQRHSRSQK